MFQVRPVTVNDAFAFDVSRIRQGYTNTLILHPDTPLQGFSQSISPLLSYDQNINGGNPDKPLVLNSLTLVGQDELKAESGLLLGINANASYSQPIAEGSYLNSALSLYYGIHPGSDLTVQHYGFNICGNTQFEQSWFGKSCISQSGSQRELGSSRNQYVSLEVGRAFSTSFTSQMAASLSLQRMFTYDYAQTVWGLQLDTIRNFAPDTLLTLQKGEDLPYEHALDHSISIRHNILLGRRWFTISASRTSYDGSMLFGVERSDVSDTLSVSTLIPSVGRVSVGYSRTDSTIDYYDMDSPTISIGLEALF